MCGTLISETNQKARKQHVCQACGVRIPIGFDYIKSVSADGGTAFTDKWHPECREEFSRVLYENGDDCGDPWETWENGAPPHLVAKYKWQLTEASVAALAREGGGDV